MKNDYKIRVEWADMREVARIMNEVRADASGFTASPTMASVIAEEIRQRIIRAVVVSVSVVPAVKAGQ